MSTRQKYRRVQQENQLTNNEQEVRCSNKGETRFYVQRVLKALEKFDFIEVSGVEKAIPRVLIVAEVARRRIEGLAQVLSLSSIEIVEQYLPQEEGLDEVTLKKRLSTIKVKLTKAPTEAEKTSIGYSAPLEAGQRVKHENEGRREYDNNRPQKRRDNEHEQDDRPRNTQKRGKGRRNE